MKKNTTADERGYRRDGLDSERLTIRVPEGQIDDIKRLVATGRYANKSEVVRDALRELTRQARERGEV